MQRKYRLLSLLDRTAQTQGPHNQDEISVALWKLNPSVWHQEVTSQLHGDTAFQLKHTYQQKVKKRETTENKGKVINQGTKGGNGKYIQV